MMLGALGMLLSSVIRQLENFAGVMNFVIFPMFFASSALYPLWLVQQSSPVVYTICRLNPFTYAVELIRFALYVRDRLDVARGGRCHDDRVHHRRDHRLRPGARPDRASRRRRRMMSRRILAAGLAFGVALRVRRPMRHRRAARSRLAVPADQGAAAFAGGGLVGSSARCTAGRLAAGPAGGRSRRTTWRNAACRSSRRRTKIRAFAAAGRRAEAGEAAETARRAVQRARRRTQQRSLPGWTGSAPARRNSPPRLRERQREAARRCRPITPPMRARSTR